MGQRLEKRAVDRPRRLLLDNEYRDFCDFDFEGTWTEMADWMEKNWGRLGILAVRPVGHLVKSRNFSDRLPQ